MKTCSKCGDEKPLEGFYVDRRRPSGRYPYCIECEKANARRKMLTPRARAGSLIATSKHRAAKTSREFALCVEDIQARIERGVCEKTGLAFDLTTSGDSRYNLRGPSIDRIDPDGGYVADNVQVVLLGYNLFKNQARDSDAVTLLAEMGEALRGRA